MQEKNTDSALVKRRLFLAEASALMLAACGGGGGDTATPTSTSPTPAPAPGPAPAPPPPPAPTALTIKAISTSTPAPLTPFYVTLGNFDPTKPYSVSFANSSKSLVTLTPLRTQSDGTIVLSAPLHLDSATGKTAALPGTLTVTQGSLSGSTQITISDLPSLASYGVPLGAISRAFYIHQALSLGRNINAQQAIAKYKTGSPTSTTALIGHLKTQLTNAILARNDVDRVVADNTTNIAIGTAEDGTPFGFGAGSVDLMDRVVAQYLLAYTANGTLIRPAEVRVSNRAQRLAAASQAQPQALAAPSVMQTIVQAISVGIGSTAFLSTQQTLTDQAAGKASTMDTILSSLSTAATIVTVGASIVAVGAALVPGGAVIAAGAAAIATYGVIAGVAVGAVSVGNDLVNVSTNGYSYLTAPPGSAERASALQGLESSGATLASDLVTTTIGALGIGKISEAFTLGRAATTVFDGIFNPLAKDVGLAVSAFATSTANLYFQKSFETDAATASAAAGSLAGGSDFALVSGTATITNSQGATLSGLSGIGIGDGSSVEGIFSTMADPNGNYAAVIPLENPAINYGSLVCKAYDPITGLQLASSPLNLTGAVAGATIKGPSLAGQCKDPDAANPDADDPDCD